MYIMKQVMVIPARVTHVCFRTLLVVIVIVLSQADGAAYSQEHSFPVSSYRISRQNMIRDPSGRPYVRADDFCRAIEAQYDLNRKRARAHLRKGQNLLRLDLRFEHHRSTQGVFNNQRVDLGLPIIYRQDALWLPLDPVAGLFGLETGEKRSSKREIEIDERLDEQPESDEYQVLNPTEGYSARFKHYIETHETPTARKPHARWIGFQIGLVNLHPHIRDLSLDREWCFSGAILIRDSRRFAMELRYDDFSSDQRTPFLGEEADVSIKMKGYTASFLYYFPGNKWRYYLGAGYGKKKVTVDYTSQTRSFSRRPEIGTWELKVGCDYFIRPWWSTSLEIRGIYGSELIDDIGPIFVKLDGIYIGLHQTLHF